MRLAITGALIGALSVLTLADTSNAQDGPGPSEGNAFLDQTIDAVMDGLKPFFTPEEHAMIERACGYAPGGWNGSDLNMSNGVLICANGRRVDDPELREMMHRAGERISRRVSAAMSSPAVQAAIARVAAEAQKEALRNLRTGNRARDSE